ncbi:MAG: NADH-quinone oxidoreductase subunit N [Candidatus Syntropharchaeia archaeon]
MSYELLLPELIICSASLLVLVGVFLEVEKKRYMGYLSILAISISLFLVIKDSFTFTSFEGTILGKAVVIDPVAQFFNIVFLSISLLVCIAALKYVKEDPRQEIFYSLLLFATFGMMIVAISNDLITLFVGFELASLATYPLPAFSRDQRGIEASMKYFVIGALSSAILLFGLAYMYGLTGSINFESISSSLSKNPSAILGIIFIIAGFGFKMALVPFHMWAIDVYDGAPHVITALLSSGSKKMAFIAAFKVIIVGAIALKIDWYIGFAILSVATMTLGNVVALIQKSVKRMLAYSSVAHAGYIGMVFVIVGWSTAKGVSEVAIAGGILHVFSHALMNAGAFIVCAIVAAYITSKSGEDSIEKYAGLGKVAPITAILMAILLFSLGGVPPTFGFYSKFVIFLSAIQAGLLWLAIIGVLNSALSLYYYARVVMYMYWREPTGERIREPIFYLIPVGIATVLVLFFGVYPEPLYHWALEGAKILLGGLP